MGTHIVPAWGLALTDHLDVTFSVKELLQEIKGKVEKIDDHVHSLEVSGTARENALTKQVTELSHKFNDLERTMATRVAVEQTINTQEKQARNIRYASISSAAAILLVVVEFFAIYMNHGH